MCVRAGSAPNTQSSSGIRVVKSDFSLDAPAYTRELWTRRTVHIFLSERGRGTGDGERRTALAELAFRDGIMDRIRMRESRFDERAYLFVLTALEFCQQRLPERRHINGRELAIACRELALDHYGVLARLVLESWGVRTTA